MIYRVAWKNIGHKPLNALLCGVLLTAGVAIISVLMLLQGQVQEKFEANIRDVDLVLGAKGSPLQLILSAVYQMDHPTGNIRYAEAEKWMRHPMVATAIPLAYGDSYRGFRIVGTTQAYLEKYGAAVATGKTFGTAHELVAGSAVARKIALRVGDTIVGTHGTAETGDSHHEHPYRITGILTRTGTVVDNLLVGNLESVWDIHEEAGERASGHHHHREVHAHENMHEHEPEDDHADEEHAVPNKDTRSITAVLVQFRNPMGVVQWPRLIAETTGMQAAVPAIEINRLFSLLGVGMEVLAWLGWAIVALAGLSLFVALYNSLKERRYELALLRTMGASRGKLVGLVLLESLWLCALGFVGGILLGRLVLWRIAVAADREYRIALEQFGPKWPEEGLLSLFVLAVGIAAALLPAWRAYSINISKTLADA